MMQIFKFCISNIVQGVKNASFVHTHGDFQRLLMSGSQKKFSVIYRFFYGGFERLPIVINAVNAVGVSVLFVMG